MIDNHVHVGWYTDCYHSPMEVWQAEREAGVNEIVVSSTSTCAELYKLVVREMRELICLGGSRVHPLDYSPDDENLGHPIFAAFENQVGGSEDALEGAPRMVLQPPPAGTCP